MPGSAGHFAFFDHRHAVHQDIIHALGELVGLLEGGYVLDGGGVEDDDVGAHALLEHAAIGEAHALRRQRGEFADGIFERERVIFADIFSKNAGEGAVGAGVGVFLGQQAFGEVPCESLSTETQGCWRASVTSGSSMPNTATSVKALSLMSRSQSASMGLLSRALRLGEALALERQQFGILDDAIRMASGPGISCHSLSQRRWGQHVLADARARRGVFETLDELASPPSCAQGGMKAEKVLNQAV